MIEWMQKHKRWLVITIWISTISFIAAGMAGWGSYSFNLNEGIAAKVGNLRVTQQQVQNRYRQLYTQYNSDGQLDAQKAQELGLENIAFKGLIEEALLRNLAHDLGLRVTHQEITDEIVGLDYFQKENKFDPLLYKELLKQNGIKPSEFEEEVKNDILVKKIVSVIPFGEATNLEKKTFIFPFEIQDEIKIKILTYKNTKPQITPEELKEFWTKHKDQFEHSSSTKIEYVLTQTDSQTPSHDDLKKLYDETKSRYIDQNGNLQSFTQVQSELFTKQQEIMAEDKALREYITLKKSDKKYGQEKILIEGDKSLGLEVLETIEKGQIGETFKPIKTPTGFIVVKILEKIPRHTKKFEEAKDEVLAKLQNQKNQEEIIKQAQTLVQKGFEGKTLTINNDTKIDGLTQEENQSIIPQIFSLNQKRGYIPLNQKILVFEIINQTLKSAPKETQNIDQLVNFYKGQMISKEFYNYLRNQYKITTFK